MSLICKGASGTKFGIPTTKNYQNVKSHTVSNHIQYPKIQCYRSSYTLVITMLNNYCHMIEIVTETYRLIEYLFLKLNLIDLFLRLSEEFHFILNILLRTKVGGQKLVGRESMNANINKESSIQCSLRLTDQSQNLKLIVWKVESLNLMEWDLVGQPALR